MILDKINQLLEQEETEEIPKFEIASDDETFTKMADFIMNLDPDRLSSTQLQKVVDIIDNMETEALGEEVKARWTKTDRKQYADKYYKKNKNRMKRKKKELERSIEGKKRDNVKDSMAKGRKTPTGRHKVEYNT